MESTRDRIRQATALLAAVDASSLDDHELCAVTAALEEAGRLLDTSRAIVAAEIDDRSRFELGRDGLSYRLGNRKPVHFLENLARVSQAEAQRRIALGRAIRPREWVGAQYPVVASAMHSGQIGTDAAAAITRTLDLAARHRALPEALAEAEHALVESALTKSADLVRTEASVWRVALDPDGVAPREAVVRERRGARLSREFNGITTLTVTCDPELAATLRTAFGVASRPGREPVFLSEEERARGTADDGTFVDPRTREQRNHDTLLGLVTAGLRSDGPLRTIVSVVATVHLTDLMNGTGAGWIDGVDEPVSIDTIQRLACDAGYRKLVLGTRDEPLFLGRTERLFTAAQRKARAAIDGGCVMCGAPALWTEMHHPTPWSEGGGTDIENGVLLCPADHQFIHTSDYQLKLFDSRPYLLAPPYIDPTQTWQPLRQSRHTMTAALHNARKAG